MAGRGSVLSGLRAAQSYATSSAGGSAPHPSYVSPLLGQYAQWTMGRQSQAMALPRDPLQFLTGAFGPLAPIRPIGIDEPQEGEQRPMPRRWQYPVAWNMPVGNPGSEGLKLADFQTLRLYSEIYSVARACIQLRKDEILGINWDIGPTADASKKMRGDKKARQDFEERRAAVLKFFRRPDPNYNDFTTWLEAVLEDILVIDALSIYMHPSSLPGKGVLGSNLAGLDLIAGDTIRPLLDLRGQSPKPPNPAYQQYLYGVPRTDLMTVMMGDDIKGADLGKLVEEYRSDQLMYLPRNPRSWTPYGQSPMERCIVPVITGLRRQQYQMDFYLEGTIPGMFIAPGDPDMTPNQLRELQDTLNALAGDQAWKHKIIVVPAGSKIDPQKPPELSDQTDEVIMTQVLMAYSVMPLELGILPKIAATQTPSAARLGQDQANVQERKTLKPDLLWLKVALFDKVIQEVIMQTDMEWRWDGLEEDKDELTKTQLLIEQIKAGLCSIDEGRIEIGRDPWNLEITSDPGWATAAGFLPLEAINPDTGMPYATEGLAPNGVPAIPGTPPGSSRSGRAPVTPGKPPVTGPARPASAGPQQRPDPVAGTRKPSPAVSAAGEQSVAKPRPVPKAALAELDALRRHLNKGRNVITWDNRHLPPEVMLQVAACLDKGMTPDQAIMESWSIVEKMLDGSALIIKNGDAAADGFLTVQDRQDGPEPDDLTGEGSKTSDSLARKVAQQLLRDYPKESLGWVLNEAQWSGPMEVPTDRIDYSHRKSWNAWEETGRVNSMRKKMKQLSKEGKHLEPAILVDRPDSERGTHLIVIDGHHRAMAALKCGLPLFAWIGKVDRVKGPWLEFHTKQNPERHSHDPFGYEKPGRAA